MTNPPPPEPPTNPDAVRFVELHDARILDVLDADSTVTVQLNAFVLDDETSETLAGVWQRIDFELEEAHFDWERGAESWVTDGVIRLGDQEHDNGVTLPFDERGDAVLDLFGPDVKLLVRGSRIRAIIAGPPTDREPGLGAPA